MFGKKDTRQKNFIMMGPVKHLQKVNKDREAVVFYKRKDIKQLASDLVKAFRPYYSRSYRTNKKPSFCNLSVYIAFFTCELVVAYNQYKFFEDLKDAVASKVDADSDEEVEKLYYLVSERKRFLDNHKLEDICKYQEWPAVGLSMR